MGLGELEETRRRALVTLTWRWRESFGAHSRPLRIVSLKCVQL